MSFYRSEYVNGQGVSSVNYYDIAMLRVLKTSDLLPYHSYVGVKYDCGKVSTVCGRRGLCPASAASAVRWEGAMPVGSFRLCSFLLAGGARLQGN